MYLFIYDRTHGMMVAYTYKKLSYRRETARQLRMSIKLAN